MKAYLSILNTLETEKIQEATLKLLENTGVSVGSDAVVEHLAACGAKTIGNNVRFPHEMVIEALQASSPKITYAGMDDRRSFTFPEGNRTFLSTSGYGAFYYPEPGAKRRMSTAQDLVKIATLAEQLDDIDFFWPTTMPTEESVTAIQEMQSYNVAVRHTGKHVEVSCSSPEAAEWEVRLAEALAGGSEELKKRPLLSVVASPTTPLAFEKATVEAYPILAKAGVPLNPMNVPIAGSTAPATFAGTLTVGNAEQLAALTILKSYNPDAPFVYSGDENSADMATGNISFLGFAPDYDLFSVAAADIARAYGLPNCVGHGCNENKVFTSVDAFMSNVMRIAYTLTTRTDLSVWVGGADSSIATSIWDIMLDIEAIKYAKAYCKELEVSDETIGLEAIDEVGPHGEFMSSPHTLEHFREELNIISPEKSYLFADGGTDYVQKAFDKGNEIIENAMPFELGEDLAKELDGIMAAARKALA